MLLPNVASMFKWVNDYFPGAPSGSQDFLQLIEESSGTVLGWIDETGTLRGSLATGSGSGNAISIQGVPVSAIPPTDGQTLIYDSVSGTYLLGASGGVPGGSPTQIQFNNTGVFGGIPGSSADGVNGLMALAPTGTGIALQLTGDAAGSTVLAVSTAGTDPGGTVISVTAADTDGANPAFGLSFTATENDSTGAGVEVNGVGGFAAITGTDVTGDMAIGGDFEAQDTSTGGQALEVAALRVQVQGVTGQTQSMMGLHVLSPFNTAVSMSGILIDSQAGAAAVTTDPGDPSVFGPVSIAPSGTAVALTLTGDAHTSNIQNWKNNAGTLVVDINNRGGVVIAPSGTATVALSVTGDSHSSFIQSWTPNGGSPTMAVAHDGSLFLGANIGFYGTTPQPQPTVTGSKGGNAALASLMTALSGLGLVVDSTT